MKEKLYNLDQLHAIASGNDDFVKKMVGLFAEMVQQFIDRVMQGLGEENFADIAAAAHKLKPSIDMMGIVKLKEKIRELEKRGKESIELETLPQLIEEIVTTLQAVVDQLKSDQ